MMSFQRILWWSRFTNAEGTTHHGT